MYQFTSPNMLNFLIFLLNELRLSIVLSFLGSLDQMREPKYFIECPPYRTGLNLVVRNHCCLSNTRRVLQWSNLVM